MNLMTYRLVGAAFLVALLTGCSDRSADTAGGGAHAEEEAMPTDRVAIPSTVRSNLGITFASVERRRVESTIRVPGAFELRPLARHEYRMTIPGRVELLVDQYDAVGAGDVLFLYRSPEWPELQHEIIEGEQAIETARASSRVARARIDEAEARLGVLRERLESLARAEFRAAELEAQVSELEASLPRLRAEYEQGRTAEANAQRTREHALHRASAATGIPEDDLGVMVDRDGESIPSYRLVDWIEVRATEPGVVEALAVTDGGFAEAPSLVLSTVDPTRVRFRAMALQSDLLRFGAIETARIVAPSGAGGAVDASVTLGLDADPMHRTVELLASPAEVRSWMRPGVSAFVEIVVDTTGGMALAIPRASVVQDGIVHVFFRRDPNDPNKAIRVEADLGVDDGAWVAIQSGLSLGDEVVLDGAYELKLASSRSGTQQKGGHFHADGTFHGEDH